MKKICFVLSSLAIGGAEQVTINLANQIALDKNISITFLIIKSKLDLKDRLSNKINLHILDSNKNSLSILKMLNFFKNNKFDKIFGVTDTCSSLLAIVSFFTKLEYFHISHTNWHKVLSNKPLYKFFFYILITLSSFRAKKWIFVSQGMLSSYRIFLGSYKKRVVIYNAAYSKKIVDHYRSINISKLDILNLVAVGRFHFAKGFDILIESIYYLKKEFPSIRLHIYGNGSEKKTLLNLISKFEIENNIVFHGFSDNVLQDLSKYYIYIHPSRWDGLPTTLIEASALGLICISFDCDFGPREIIQDSYSGILIQDLENPKVLAKNISAQLNRPNFDLGYKAVLTSKKFSSETVAKEYLDI